MPAFLAAPTLSPTVFLPLGSGTTARRPGARLPARRGTHTGYITKGGTPAVGTLSGQGRADGAPLHLDMRVGNFGPIKRANISLRPLTVFIGPGNTGKSYAAMLAHSIMSSSRGRGRHHAPIGAAEERTKSKALEAIGREMSALAPEKEAELGPKPASLVLRACTLNLGRRMENEIVRNFGSPLSGLVRAGARSFSVSLQNSTGRIMTYGGRGMRLGPISSLRITLKSTTGVKGGGPVDVAYGDGAVRCAVNPDFLGSAHRSVVPRRAYEGIESAVLMHALPGLPAASHYFPAARTGILQAYRVIASGIIKSAPYAGIKDIQIPRLSGVASDFVSMIMDLQPFHGTHYDIGSLIESDMFGGHVDLKHPDRNRMPELAYGDARTSVPIHRASSTISELAPLTLCLKHRAMADGMLAIEEPEAHLHPRSQVRLAGHMVRLIRSGVNVMITTHSAVLLESISQYLQASPLRPKDRRHALGTGDLYLREGEVAPHLFKADGRGGSIVEKIPLSAGEGIAQDEFIDVDRTLNEANIRIGECAA